MNDEEIKKEDDQIKHLKQEILDDYKKLDKSYFHNVIVELIFFLIIIIFLLIFLFRL